MRASDWRAGDRQLVRAAVVVHAGDCPRGACACEPLELLRSR